MIPTVHFSGWLDSLLSTKKTVTSKEVRSDLSPQQHLTHLAKTPLGHLSQQVQHEPQALLGFHTSVSSPERLKQHVDQFTPLVELPKPNHFIGTPDLFERFQQKLKFDTQIERIRLLQRFISLANEHAGYLLGKES